MPPSTPSPQSPRRRVPVSRRTVAGLGAIALTVGGIALAFAGTAGWLSPSRLSGADVADVLERHNGEHPGFRRAHEKGICIVGHFDSNGRGQALSKAAVLAPGRTPVFGRFALAVGSPYRSEEHTSELQSLMRNSYAVFCLKKTPTIPTYKHSPPHTHKYT